MVQMAPFWGRIRVKFFSWDRENPELQQIYHLNPFRSGWFDVDILNVFKCSFLVFSFRPKQVSKWSRWSSHTAGQGHSSTRSWKRTICRRSVWTWRPSTLKRKNSFKRLLILCVCVPQFQTCTVRHCKNAFALQLHAPLRLEIGLLWWHQALRWIGSHRLVALRVIRAHISIKCV